MPLFLNFDLRRALRHTERAAANATDGDYADTADLCRSALTDEQAFGELLMSVRREHAVGLAEYLKTDAAKASSHPILDYLVSLIPTIIAILAGIFHFPVPPIPPLPPVP